MNTPSLIEVRDGTICEAAYWSAKLRIVHWYKEPTKSNGIGPNLLSDVNLDTGYVKWRLWHVTARRTHAILNGLPSWSDLVSALFAKDFISAAVLNMNNTIPEGVENRFTTDNALCLANAVKYWPKRREKLLDLKPSVVICGGTFPLTKSLFDDRGEAYQDLGDVVIWQGIPFVKACHPSFRGNHQKECEQFRLRLLTSLPWIRKARDK